MVRTAIGCVRLAAASEVDALDSSRRKRNESMPSQVMGCIRALLRRHCAETWDSNAALAAILQYLREGSPTLADIIDVQESAMMCSTEFSNPDFDIIS